MTISNFVIFITTDSLSWHQTVTIMVTPIIIQETTEEWKVYMTISNFVIFFMTDSHSWHQTVTIMLTPIIIQGTREDGNAGIVRQRSVNASGSMGGEEIQVHLDGATQTCQQYQHVLVVHGYFELTCAQLFTHNNLWAVTHLLHMQPGFKGGPRPHVLTQAQTNKVPCVNIASCICSMPVPGPYYM